MDYVEIAAVLDVITKLPGTSNQYPYIAAAAHKYLRELNTSLANPPAPVPVTITEEHTDEATHSE